MRNFSINKRKNTKNLLVNDLSKVGILSRSSELKNNITKSTFTLSSLFLILLVSIAPNVFADDTVNVSIPDGTSVPGCENGIPGGDETPICYDPSTITVMQGTNVVWTNDDSAAHTVTSGIFYQDGQPNGPGPDGIFDSNILVAGDLFSYEFDETGDFPYFCLIHPWMIGKVISQGSLDGDDEPQIPDIDTIDTKFGITVETDEVEYMFGDSIKIFGKVEIIIFGTLVNVQVINPEVNLVFIENILVLDDGSFVTVISNTDSAIWQNSGTYNVKATYGDKIRDETTFRFDATEYDPIPKPKAESIPFDIDKTPPVPVDNQKDTYVEKKVPNWLRNDAREWATGQLQDHEFSKGIGHLVKEKIIDGPDISPQTNNAQKQVPDWVKHNARWWTDGLVSESEFVNGIEYLVRQGIITV